jgi:hypothetical protein
MSYEACVRGGAAEELARVDALVGLGIDSPLKLDIMAAIERGGRTDLSPERLAAVCGASPRDVVATLDELARARVVECRRFYNIPEYELSPSEEVRFLVRTLIGPRSRRLRAALLARVNK